MHHIVVLLVDVCSVSGAHGVGCLTFLFLFISGLFRGGSQSGKVDGLSR